MEVFPYLFIAAVVLFGPWVLLFSTRRRMRQERQDNAARLTDLTGRVHELEQSLKQVQAAQSSPAERKQQLHVQEPVYQQQPVVRPEAIQTHAEPAAPASAMEPKRPSKLVSGAPAQAQTSVVTEQPPLNAPHAPPPPPVSPPIAARQQEPLPSATQPAASGWFDSVKGGLNFEEALGANWLNKIGIVILVFGVAFFLAYQLRQVGPAGKVLVGTLASAALLGGGIFLERKPGYRIIGRAAIGGGWALAFFVAYATYHVPAAHIFSWQTPSLLLMLAVAAAMVLHTLRYRSQVTTGLAFLLAFLTLTISQVTVYSLIAGVILALGLVAIVGRMQWFELEIFGIAAADPGAGKELREHALVRAHWFDDAAQPLTSDSGTIR